MTVVPVTNISSPYSAEISRQNPAAVLILIDQSGSMGDAMQAMQNSKSGFLADAVNRILMELTMRCAKGEEIRDYFHIGVLGYGTHVGNALPTGGPAGELVPISAIANNVKLVEQRKQRVADGAGGIIVQDTEFPIWVDPVADGGTPMVEVFRAARQLLDTWVKAHSASFPPIVLHFTDGEPTSGDPSADAAALRALRTGDGNVLLFNCHISSGSARTIEFPASDEVLPDQYSKSLFAMSSELTPVMRQVAGECGAACGPGARAFVYNARAEQVVSMLQIGTRAATVR